MPIFLLFILILPALSQESDFQEIDPKREEFLAKKQRAFEVVRGAQDKWEQKMREEKLAKEKLEQEKKREEAKIAREKKIEEERIAREKKAEEERIAREKKIEEERIAREKKIEEERIAREKKIEEEKLAKVNEEQRKKKEEEYRLAKFKEDAKRGWEELLKKKAEADKGGVEANASSGGANSIGISKFPEDGNGKGNGTQYRLESGYGKRNGARIGMGSGNGNGMSGRRSHKMNNCSYQGIDTSACENNKIDRHKKARFEMYSPDGIVDTGVFSVRFYNDEATCGDAVTACMVNFCQNPNVPFFCEFDGKIIAEQNMGPYKTAGGYKKKERKQEPSVVQVYKCTEEITENKLYEVYSVYTFDAPDVFKSHFEAKTGSCQEALTNCFYNMHLNPQRPIFCEWGGNIIAEQHMASFERPYKKTKPIKPVLH